MAQNTQFHVQNGTSSMNVAPADLAAYLAAGWHIVSVRYSVGAEDIDANTLVLMQKGTDSISVKAADVSAYLADGYSILQMTYGADRIVISASSGQMIEFLDTPDFYSAEIGTVNDTTVAVTFSTDITASDYAAGVTIKVNTVSKTISAAERQTDHKVVYYTIPAVAFGETVTWSYDDATGGIHSESDGTYMDDVTNGEVTNNVPEA